MGLDMYAFKSKHAPTHKCNFRDNNHPLTGEEGYYTATDDQLLKQWRKHYDLHQWMQELYDTHDGKKDDFCHFNCNSIELDRADLEQLRVDLLAGEMPKPNLPDRWTAWYRQAEHQEETRAEDLQFIVDALKAINEGFHVYYTSWW